MKLTLGISPCPNDTFIFDALVNGGINSDLEFDVTLADVEKLNEWAKEGRLDISKMSFAALGLVSNQYTMLDAGGAMGAGVGPLVISKEEIASSQVSNKTIAIPGRHTTAHLLFNLAFPDATQKLFMPFSEIEQAVLSGVVEVGVIIHESRFTYLTKGLRKVVDLGEYWQNKTGTPIPLGVIAVKKHLNHLKEKLEMLIRASVDDAWKRYPILSEYVVKNAHEMDEVVMRKHIELYVNEYTRAFGEKGRDAIDMLTSMPAI